MPGGDKPADNKAKSVNGMEHEQHGSPAATAENPLQQQAGKELITPGNNFAGSNSSSDNSNVFWARTTPEATSTNKDAELSRLLASFQPIVPNQSVGNYGTLEPPTKQNIDQLLAKLGTNPETQSKQFDALSNTLKPTDAAQLGQKADVNNHAPKEIKLHLHRPIEIKLRGKADYHLSGSLIEAKAHFLDTFSKHGGDAMTAKTYINKMIKEQHDLAQYAKENPKEKVHFVKDKYLAGTLNEYTRAMNTKRTGTGGELSQKEFDRKMLGLVKAIADPIHKINQGQIGSCALHAGVKFVIAERPDLMAAVGTKILTKGEYRGKFTKEDMGPASGQDETEHMLGTAMLRATYKSKHLTKDYGGTTASALGAGIKRITNNKVHAVWSNDKTAANGADLDITMGGAHCQYTVTRAFNENGRLVLKEKTDNTWKGFRDGTWRPAS